MIPDENDSPAASQIRLHRQQRVRSQETRWGSPGSDDCKLGMKAALRQQEKELFSRFLKKTVAKKNKKRYNALWDCVAKATKILKEGLFHGS